MRFCYCPECDTIRPRNWYSRDRCTSCDVDCIIYNVKRSIYGYIMYLLDAVAVVLIFLHIAHNDLSWETVAFMSEIPGLVTIIAIFGLIFISLGFGYVDLTKTTEVALEKALSDKRDSLI